MKIQVASETIRSGQRKSRTDCPVARAVREATGLRASIFFPFVFLYDNHNLVAKVQLPIKVIKTMTLYDGDEKDNWVPMTPFDFELAVEESLCQKRSE